MPNIGADFLYVSENAIFGNEAFQFVKRVTKMMYYNDLDGRVIRERVDMVQIWQAWLAADDLRRHSYLGALGWEIRAGHSYLYSRKRGVVKSLGPRSSETEEIHAAFHAGRAANKARLSALAAEIDRQAAVLRALDAGRLPLTAAKTLRALRSHHKAATIRVIGTNALYAYEALAGVTFNADAMATGDVDILVDDRNRLRLLTEAGEAIGLARLLQQSVDKSFQSRGPMDYRLTNDKGYMVEFLRPEPSPAHRPMPGAAALEEGDVQPVPILGLQWLVNAPVVEVAVLDARGYPAPMRCPDPRFWAAHKLWLSTKSDRDPPKKLRDRQQADMLLSLIADRLPQFPLNNAFKSLLPKELAQHLGESEKPKSSGPNW